MLLDYTILHSYKASEHEQISGWPHPTSSDKFCRPQFTCTGFANWQFYLQTKKTAITNCNKKKERPTKNKEFLN